MSTTVKRTYSSRKRILGDNTTSLSNKRPKLSLSVGSLNSSDTEPGDEDDVGEEKAKVKKRPMFLKAARNTATPTTTTKGKSKTNSTTKPKLRQLHLSIGQTSLRTCPLCQLSYTIGAPDDESTHRSHCARVQRGMDWSRELDRDTDVVDVRRGIRLKNKKTMGRVVSVRGDAGGKVGAKMTSLLSTIDLALSSPALTREILSTCKIYLFLVPSPSPSNPQKEKIAGCVVAQRITKARELVSPSSQSQSPDSPEDTPGPLCLSPQTYPASLGIARLFVPSTTRLLGIARALLDVAAETFIHGCPLDPKAGDVAFTQPTSGGEAVMRSWGGGAVRVYEETDC